MKLTKQFPRFHSAVIAFLQGKLTNYSQNSIIYQEDMLPYIHLGLDYLYSNTKLSHLTLSPLYKQLLNARINILKKILKISLGNKINLMCLQGNGTAFRMPKINNTGYRVDIDFIVLNKDLILFKNLIKNMGFKKLLVDDQNSKVYEKEEIDEADLIEEIRTDKEYHGSILLPLHLTAEIQKKEIIVKKLASHMKPLLFIDNKIHFCISIETIFNYGNVNLREQNIEHDNFNGVLVPCLEFELAASIWRFFDNINSGYFKPNLFFEILIILTGKLNVSNFNYYMDIFCVRSQLKSLFDIISLFIDKLQFCPMIKNSIRSFNFDSVAHAMIDSFLYSFEQNLITVK